MKIKQEQKGFMIMAFIMPIVLIMSVVAIVASISPLLPFTPFIMDRDEICFDLTE